MKILAIDPGVTTGYCFADLQSWPSTYPGLSLRIKPEQHLDDVEECWDRIEEYKPRYIVCEDFEFRQKTRTGLVLYSVQLIGVVALYEAKSREPNPCSLYIQKAAQGKGYYTNKLMKDLGVYKPGQAWEHSMDATRHLLHWLTFGAGYQFIQGKEMKDIVRLV